MRSETVIYGAYQKRSYLFLKDFLYKDEWIIRLYRLITMALGTDQNCRRDGLGEMDLGFLLNSQPFHLPTPNIPLSLLNFTT